MRYSCLTIVVLTIDEMSRSNADSGFTAYLLARTSKPQGCLARPLIRQQRKDRAKKDYLFGTVIIVAPGQ